MPVALAVAGGGVFLGRGRLLERPYGPYEAIFQQQGITFQRQPDSITLSGALKPGRFEVPGDVSSQFITGLLYALPLLDGESEIVLTTALESRGYVDLTLEALKQFGVQVSFTEHGWQVPGGQRYQSADVAVEGDYSQAANFILRPAWAIHSRWRACGRIPPRGTASSASMQRCWMAPAR